MSPKTFGGEIMENSDIRAKLLEVLESGVVNGKWTIGIVRLNSELRRLLVNRCQCYINDSETTKSKTKIIAEFCMDAAENGVRYSPDLVNAALTILKSMGYNIKDVQCYYDVDFPAVITVDGEVGVVIKPEHMEDLRVVGVKKLTEF